MSSKKATGSAAGQYLGYALQPVRLFYYLISCQRDAVVGLEHADDVSVHMPDGSVLVEQCKSATKSNPISDWAEELWKTFNIWVDNAEKGIYDASKTQFRLYVTPPKSGKTVQKLSDLTDEAEIESFIQELVKKRSKVASDTKSSKHLDAIMAADRSLVLQIVRNFKLIASDKDPLAPLFAHLDPDKLDREQLRLRTIAEESVGRLNNVRMQIRELERRSDEVRAEIFRADQIERYLGRLEQAISLYERAGEDAELNAEIADLQERILTIRGRISEHQIRSKIQNALAEIEAIAGRILPNLDAEWPDAAIKFILNDLTIKVVQGTRDDYLWEIGSGANWLAYHVSMTLAFQRFFLQSIGHAVPNFLVYDQPSQVYFPQSPRGEDDDEVEWHNEDIIAVRKVFSAVSHETKKAKGSLQVIILDHADSKVWGDIENVKLVEEWRDNEKLVPVDWLS